jgi:hypothetical protein
MIQFISIEGSEAFGRSEAYDPYLSSLSNCGVVDGVVVAVCKLYFI